MYRSSPFDALWTRVTLGLDMCALCTEAVHSVALWTRVTLGLDMCALCTEAVHSVALWTRVTLGLDMCALCTEAVHSVALWTLVTLQVWTCVHYVPNHWKRRKVHENIRPDINAPPTTTNSQQQQQTANNNKQPTTTNSKQKQTQTAWTIHSFYSLHAEYARVGTSQSWCTGGLPDGSALAPAHGRHWAKWIGDSVLSHGCNFYMTGWELATA